MARYREKDPDVPDRRRMFTRAQVSSILREWLDEAAEGCLREARLLRHCYNGSFQFLAPPRVVREKLYAYLAARKLASTSNDYY